MQTGLRKVAGAAGAFDQYWRTEVDPVLGAGYRPPIADGFRRFLATESIATAMARFVEKEEKEGESNPYDTHPPLRERLAALERVPGPRFAADIRAAIELLADPVGLERQMLDHLLVADYARKLEDVRWEDVGEDVYVPSWQETLAKDGSVFAGIAVGDLADRLSDLDGFTKTLASRPQGSPEDQEAHARWLAGVALASALVRHGWSVRALPGEPITLSGPDGDFTPFGVTAELADRKADPGEWRERCHRLGIADLPLAA
jgi:hypothetical protein